MHWASRSARPTVHNLRVADLAAQDYPPAVAGLPAPPGAPVAGARPAPLTRSPAPQRLLAAGAVLVAIVAGALLARDVTLGLALVGTCGFAALVLLDVPFAVAAWVPVAWIEYSHLTGRAPVIATVALLVGWVASRRARGRSLRVGVADRTAMLAVGLLLVWLTLSMAWASERSLAWGEAKSWYVAAAAFFVIANAMASPRNIRILVLAFVVGALVSILVGLTGHGGLTTTADALDLATRQRFAGGQGDPNYLAAGLVAAIALAAGLLPSIRDPIARLGLVASIVAIAAALAATESRGGLIGALVAIVAAIILARRQRLQAAVFGVCAIAAAGAFFLASPSALDRVTSFNAGGNGRAELWKVGWRMTEAHPVTGVGLAGFQPEAKNYVREPGSLEFVRLIVDEPHVTHNVYLQQLAETGVVGLVLLLAVIGASLGAAARAARRFDALGEPALATLARAVIIASIGFLTASLFISNSTDKRLWILLALGPALLGAAHRAQHVRSVTHGSITRR
jgi:O-antigen ligase